MWIRGLSYALRARVTTRYTLAAWSAQLLHKHHLPYEVISSGLCTHPTIGLDGGTQMHKPGREHSNTRL